MDSFSFRRVGVFIVLAIGASLLAGCAGTRASDVAGVYALDSSAVRDLAAESVDGLSDPEEQMAMGMALTMLQALDIRLHLKPDGTAFVTGIQPAPRGSWGVSGDQVTTLMGTPTEDAGRMEGVLTDGTLVFPAGNMPGLPFSLVFRKLPDVETEPIVEPRDVVDPDDIQSE